jgi:hypothetical protein
MLSCLASARVRARGWTHARSRAWVGWCLVSLLVVLWGCAGRTPPPVIGLPETHAGPLLQLVPSWATTVVSMRPKELAQNPAMVALWRAVVREDRELAFVERTGVDPLEVTEFVIVDSPDVGYLLFARGPFMADDVVRRAGERIAIVDVSSEEPHVRREGLRGDGRYAYASIDTHTILAAKDAPPDFVHDVLVRIEDPKSPRALDPAEAHSLEVDHMGAPIAAIQLGHLPFEPGSPIALLISRQRALGLSVRPVESALSVILDLRGEFPPGAEQNFRTLVRSMGQAPLGAALGLSSVAENMGVRADEQGVLITASLETAALEGALRLMFGAEMRELLE